MKHTVYWFACCTMVLFVSVVLGTDTAVPRPNIVIVLLDDMGFADFGCYGGEIQTPNIDALAANGLSFRQFYNTARCSPTRASLLTGLHPHQTGMGTLANTETSPPNPAQCKEGYRGYLNRRCVTLAEVLGPAGYHTYMAGKWHLGYHDQVRWPVQRGFERFYGILTGACDYFNPQTAKKLLLDNTPVKGVDPDGEMYYTTDAFTKYAIRFIQEQDDDRPFFLYLAYTAPHFSLHARRSDFDLYRNRYTDGWDRLRQERRQRQIDMGLAQENWGLSPRDSVVRSWETISSTERKTLSEKMAIYAAMVHRVDFNVGRLVQVLQDLDKFDNTLIFILSDNGATREPSKEKDRGRADVKLTTTTAKTGTYGAGWAQASNTPFRRFKTELYEGGIATPLIVHWPAGLPETQVGAWTDAPGYLIDIMPTLLDVADVNYPDTYGNYELRAIEGKSLVPIFETGERENHEYMYWEHVNNRAIRWGYWKAVWNRDYTRWELFDIENDRTERHDLAKTYPEIVSQLSQEWERWAYSHNVLPKEAPCLEPGETTARRR